MKTEPEMTEMIGFGDSSYEYVKLFPGKHEHKSR